MKKINSTAAREHSDLFAKEFDKLQNGEQFIYADSSFEFSAIKINNDYAALVNSRGKFILGKKYKNCLSIGSGLVSEYDTLAEIEEAAESKEGIELSRLNLKIPTEIKEYLTVAAAKASMNQKRNISLTQYLCDLVTADMEKHKNV